MTTMLRNAVKTATRRVTLADCDAATLRNARTLMQDARTRLMLDAPFYGAMATRLALTPRADRVMQTAATDGHSLFYNPLWIVQQTPRALVGLLAHETMHVAHGHTLRREGRNARDWNIAADHVINNELTGSGFELPEDGCCDPEYKGWSAEEVYDRVKRPEPPPIPPPPVPQEECEEGEGGKGGEDGEPGEDESESDDDDDTQRQRDDDAPEDESEEEDETGDASQDDDETEEDNDDGDGGEDDDTDDGGDDDGDGDDDSDDDSDDTDDDGEEELPAGAVLDSPDPVGDESEISLAVIEAARIAEKAGNCPAAVKRLVNELTRTPMNWRDVLEEFLERNLREDYNWSQPNRRYLSQGVYLPSLKSEAAPELALFGDNSGSINERQFSTAVNAISDIVTQLQPERVHVAMCDTAVNFRATFERGEDIVIETDKGGGGTWFAPPFDALAEEGIEPACAVYFTADACGSFGAEPPYPVLWITEPGAATPPWGQVVVMEPAREDA